MKIASWCYDRFTPSLYSCDDHCYTSSSSAMSLQSDTRPNGDSTSTLPMTVDVDMEVDVGGVDQRQRARVNTTSSSIPRVSGTATSTVTSGTTAAMLVTDAFKDSKDSIQELKKSLTLDFSSPESAKKSLATPELLSFLRFTSPDLEKFIVTQQQFSTTPNGLQVGGGNTPTPTSCFYPKNVTAEQEQYARGFIDALNQLHLLRGPCIPMTSLLSPGFVTTTIQQADKDDLSKYRESGVTVEQLFRTLTAGAVWSPGTPFGPSIPSTTSVGTSTAGPSVIPTTINIPVQSSVIFPPLHPNQLSVITTSTNNNHNATSGISNLAAAAVAALKVDSAATQQQQQQQTNSHSPSPCLSPNSASCSSVHSDQIYTPPPTQVPAQHSSNVNYATVPVTFGSLIVPGSMLPTAQFITLPSGTSHSPRVNTSTNVHRQLHHQLNTSRLGVNVKVEDSSTTSTTAGKQSLQFTTTSAGSGSSASSNNNNSQNGSNNNSGNLPAGISVSPMDPRSQERMKLERKRARNRVAATKCRRRKIEKITNLDEKVKELIKQNDEIESRINTCKQDVTRLRQLVKEHQLRGCNMQMI